MNKTHGITAENLLLSLPLVLQRDENMRALAASIAETLAARPAEIDRLLIYPSLDTQDEEMLDILAYDFKVDWWDGDYSLEEKRRTMKDSWRVHRMLGTRAAVETAISALYPDTTLEEWFEYGGKPYHFRLHINLAMDDNDIDRRRRVLDKVAYYKNLRSHCEGVEYFAEFPEMEREISVTPVLGRGLAITSLPVLEPELAGQEIRVTPVMGRGMSVTGLPPVEPVFRTAIVPGRASAAVHTAADTALPALPEFDTAITAAACGRATADTQSVTQTILKELKEEIT